MKSVPPAAVDRWIDEVPAPAVRMNPAAEAHALPDYVVDVSRPVLPWRWTSVLLAPVELLAVAWSIPFVILLAGIPIVLAAALAHRIGRFIVSYF